MGKSKPKTTIATSAPQDDFVARRIWNFCIHPDDLNQGEIYINPSTSFADFPNKSISDFSFYVNALPLQARTTEIELFAANLHVRLDTFDITPKVGISASSARGAVRATLNTQTNSIQDLIDTVLANYQENP